jgi:flagellar protein FliT
MDHETMLSVYEDVAVLSGRMLEAARGGDWDKLVALEDTCRALVGTLIATGTAQPLEPQVAERKGRLIRKVLADDAAIRDLAEPRLAELAQFLYAAKRGRRIECAYGADADA